MWGARAGVQVSRSCPELLNQIWLHYLLSLLSLYSIRVIHLFIHLWTVYIFSVGRKSFQSFLWLCQFVCLSSTYCIPLFNLIFFLIRCLFIYFLFLKMLVSKMTLINLNFMFIYFSKRIIFWDIPIRIQRQSCLHPVILGLVMDP